LKGLRNLIPFNIKRLKRAIWSWRQPLTHIPAEIDSPISDLFVWRSSENWQTFFELIDISSFFEDRNWPNKATLIFFDIKGERIFERSFELKPNRRRSLDISLIVGSSHGEIGTFAVFHTTPSSRITEFEAFLTERGYVSYCYRNAPLRSYVHGNLDAMSYKKDKGLRLLGGTSFLRREYRLQYQLQSDVSYEFALGNPTTFPMNFTFKLFLVEGGMEISKKLVCLAPGEMTLEKIDKDSRGARRLIIKSNLIMARPLVFRFKNLKLDVFHG
jgi:hypothetical protein